MRLRNYFLTGIHGFSSCFSADDRWQNRIINPIIPNHVGALRFVVLLQPQPQGDTKRKGKGKIRRTSEQIKAKEEGSEQENTLIICIIFVYLLVLLLLFLRQQNFSNFLIKIHVSFLKSNLAFQVQIWHVRLKKLNFAQLPSRGN